MRAVNAATARCYQHGAAGPWQVVTLIDGIVLLMAGDDDEMHVYDKSHVSTLRQRHQSSIVYTRAVINMYIEPISN